MGKYPEHLHEWINEDLQEDIYEEYSNDPRDYRDVTPMEARQALDELAKLALPKGQQDIHSHLAISELTDTIENFITEVERLLETYVTRALANEQE